MDQESSVVVYLLYSLRFTQMANIFNDFRGRAIIKKPYNVLLSNLRGYLDDVAVGAEINVVYYSSEDPLKFFKDSTLPNGVRDIDTALWEKYRAFSAKAIDNGKRYRTFDTELKFIFNLLESDLWQQGNRFVIELESTLTVCSSCEGYLEYLFELGRRKGKIIEVRLKDNMDIKTINNLNE